MLTSTTIEGLRTLRLHAMAQGVADQREQLDYAELSFEERLGLLVDRELLARDNRRLQRLLKTAKLRLPAAIEELDYSRPRGLDRHVILQLGESHWVKERQVVLIVGPTGVGKTFLACALAQAAIRHGHSALYLRAPRMFDELAIARADGRLARLMASWARIDVLLVDDFLIRPLSTDQAATCSRSSRTTRNNTRRSSRASCRSPTGTRPSATPPSRTPSWTDCSSAPTVSSSSATRCGEAMPPPSPATRSDHAVTATTRAPDSTATARSPQTVDQAPGRR